MKLNPDLSKVEAEACNNSNSVCWFQILSATSQSHTACGICMAYENGRKPAVNKTLELPADADGVPFGCKRSGIDSIVPLPFGYRRQVQRSEAGMRPGCSNCSHVIQDSLRQLASCSLAKYFLLALHADVPAGAKCYANNSELAELNCPLIPVINDLSQMQSDKAHMTEAVQLQMF